MESGEDMILAINAGLAGFAGLLSATWEKLSGDSLRGRGKSHPSNPAYPARPLFRRGSRALLMPTTINKDKLLEAIGEEGEG
jgi:hypothetical protein